MTHGPVTLLVDAGNTRVKFGWMWQKHGVRETATLALGHTELERLPAWLAQLPAKPKHGLGVSVAKAELVSALEACLKQHLGLSMKWLRSCAQAAHILNLYDVPEQLGHDRWVALIGLSTQASSPAVLASFGTATTIDTLGPEYTPSSLERGSAAKQATARNFEGGLILPGPELMRQSLASGTAGLPYALGDSVAFPRNTHSAINSGIAAAQAGAVIRQWRYALDVLKVTPTLYCTGGGWPLVAAEVSACLARTQGDMGLTPVAPQWLEAPVLDGLAVMAGQATNH